MLKKRHVAFCIILFILTDYRHMEISTLSSVTKLILIGRVRVKSGKKPLLVIGNMLIKIQ